MSTHRKPLWRIVLGLALALLTACNSPQPPSPEAETTAAPSAASTTTTAATATTVATATATTTTAATSTLPPTHTAAPATTTPSPTAAPTPAPVEGFTDGLLLATNDAALVLYYPGSGESVTLMQPGQYDVSGDDFLIPIIWPARFSPDGGRLLVATPDDGTWLVSLDGSSHKFHPQRLFATWSPDGQRVAYAIDSAGGELYVADPAGEWPREPLAQLPGRADSAVWSPGCAEGAAPGRACGQYIAVATSAAEGLNLWLIDADSGESRQLGSFRPPSIGGTLWHSWAADGSGVIAHADSARLFFPLDGSEPRALMPEFGPAAVPGELAPGGDPLDSGHYARLERDRDTSRSTLIVGAAGGQEVAVSPDFSQGESFQWSGDGRFVLVKNYQCDPSPCQYEIWAYDTADFPAQPEATRIAAGQALLGTLSSLAGRSSEVDPTPWAALEALPPAGDPQTWTPQTGERHAMPATGLQFAAPHGWRVESDEDAFIVANYAAESPGYALLGDEQIRIDGRWTGPFGNPFDYTDMDAMEETHFNWAVEPIEVDGRAGVLLRDRVAPVCEQILLPLGGGELNISYCPATEAWRAWMEGFLAGVELGEE